MPTRDCMHCGGFYAAVVSETPPLARPGPCCCWRRKALSLSGDCGSPCRSCWRSRDSDGRDPRMQARDRTADVGDRGDEPDQHLRELILEAWSAGKQEEIATRHALTAKRLRGANATQPMAPLIAFSHPTLVGFRFRMRGRARRGWKRSLVTLLPTPSLSRPTPSAPPISPLPVCRTPHLVAAHGPGLLRAEEARQSPPLGRG